MINIILHKQWLDNATAGLTRSLRDALPILKRQVNQGIAQLWEVETDKGKSWMITRVEHPIGGDGPELVLCCYEGCDVKHVTQHILDAAIKQGFGSIRYHTHRKGLNRLVIDLGFMPYETVYHKKLTQRKQALSLVDTKQAKEQ